MAKKPVKRATRNVQADDLPETKTTAPAKKAAAKDTFAKADEAGAPKMSEGDEIRMTQAAKGGL